MFLRIDVCRLATAAAGLVRYVYGAQLGRNKVKPWSVWGDERRERQFLGAHRSTRWGILVVAWVASGKQTAVLNGGPAEPLRRRNTSEKA